MNYYLTKRWEGFNIISEPYMDCGNVKCKVEKDGAIQEARMYTELERTAHMDADHLAAESIFASYDKETQDKINEWYKSNGFDWRGITFIAIGNTYAIKDKLQKYGWTFSKELLWHGSDTLALPSSIKIVPMKFSDLYVWSKEFNKPLFKTEAKEQIDKLKPKSEWIGKKGEKIEDLFVTLTKVTPYNSKYGIGYVYIFLTRAEDRLVWMTKSELDLKEGDTGKLFAIVKEHQIYNNEKSTLIKNVKIK